MKEEVTNHQITLGISTRLGSNTFDELAALFVIDGPKVSPVIKEFAPEDVFEELVGVRIKELPRFTIEPN